MISVGIFSGYYPYGIDETIRLIKEQGFNTVQLDVGFKDMPGLIRKHDVADSLTEERAAFIRNRFRDANVQISCIYGYTNLLAPDPVVRQKNIGYLKAMLRHARALGSPYVATETGTRSLISDYSYDPYNHTEKAYEEFRDIVADLISYARRYGATLLVEPYVNNVIHDTESVARLFEDIGPDHLGLVMDPANYFDASNLSDMDAVLKEVFDRFDPLIKIAHAKDVRLSDGLSASDESVDSGTSHTYRGSGGIDLPAAGLGDLNYDLYLDLLSKNHPNIPLILEHLSQRDIPRAKRFLDDKLKARGV